MSLLPAVRPADPADAPGIAEVHVASWQAAYAGLLPQALLDGLSVESRTEGWRRILAQDEVETFVAIDDSGVVVGYTSIGNSRDADADADRGIGELSSIYARPESWGTAVGSRLHRAAIEALAARFHQATLWVLDGNARARAFYERHGWEVDGAQRKQTLGGVDVTELRYRTPLREHHRESR